MELSRDKYIQYTLKVILTLIILFLVQQIKLFSGKITTIISIILTPILLGGFFYYLLRPIVYLLTKKIKYKILAIIITFLGLIALISFISYFGGSIIENQFHDLINDITNYYDLTRNNLLESLSNDDSPLAVLNNFNLQERVISIIDNILSTIRNNILSFFSTITNIGTIIVLIPFVLFYFLKDDKQIFHSLINLSPSHKEKEIRNLLLEIDKTLATYIGGRLIVALILGLLTYIGFLIIQLPNTLILAFISMITSFVPIIGPIVGALPAIFVAFTESLFLTLKVIIVMLIVQQLEGNVVQPNVQGERLKIHPLIVIFSILSFTILFGFIGALFAVPAYAIIKIILQYLIPDSY